MINSPLLVLVLCTLASAVTVTVPASAPSNATRLNPALISFSIEQDRWTDWAGTTSPNAFFYNALDNLKQLTGQAPWIRIGADSEDHTDYNPSVEVVQQVFPTPSVKTPYPEASHVIVGDGYYKLASHLPSGTRVIWGVNFKTNNMTAAHLEAQALSRVFASPALKAVNVTLGFIEIGNEANSYGNRQNWSTPEYVKEWTNFAQNVTAAAGISKNSSTKLIGGAFSAHSHTWSPQAIINAGILNTTAGSMIKSMAVHKYMGSFCNGSYGLLQDLMSKSTIRGNLSIYTDEIPAVRAMGLDYILGETNSYACHGAPGVSNSAGAALWTLDYALRAGVEGISRLHFHEGVGYKYSLIQPVTLTRSTNDNSTLATPLPPHVQPQYYGAIIAAEAIGSSGATTAVELSIDDPRVSGYAFYERGALKRAVLINSQAYFRNSTRATKKIDLSFSGGSTPQTMTIKRLKIRYADDPSGLTWGGQSYETTDARVGGTLSVVTADVGAGLDLTDTEAVLLNFH